MAVAAQGGEDRCAVIRASLRERKCRGRAGAATHGRDGELAYYFNGTNGPRAKQVLHAAAGARRYALTLGDGSFMADSGNIGYGQRYETIHLYYVFDDEYVNPRRRWARKKGLGEKVSGLSEKLWCVAVAGRRRREAGVSAPGIEAQQPAIDEFVVPFRALAHRSRAARARRGARVAR